MKLQKCARQLKVAQQNSKGKPRGSHEIAQLDVIKAKMALLKAQRTALRYASKKKE
jgi:hypothetical protein